MHRETSDQLHESAAAHHVATGFFDNTGRWQDVSDATLRVVLHALSNPDNANMRYPPVIVARLGQPHPWKPPDGELVHVVLESGEQRELPAALPGDLPIGYHRLVGVTGVSSLVVAPERCYLPKCLAEGGRLWGWAIQAYAIRSRTSWGMGDLGNLAKLAADETLQSDFVLINPINAPIAPADPGPYSPSSRLFRNPLYLDVEQVPERAGLVGPACNRFHDLVTVGRRLTSHSLIDRKTVFQVKEEALRLCYAALEKLPGRRSELRAWRAANPMVEAFAAFCSLQRAYGNDWRTWPAEYRHPHVGGVDRFRLQHKDEIGYHVWLQWLLEVQLTAIPRVGIGVINDFPIGVAREGFDAWIFQEQIVPGVTIGAPPDVFAPGQNWRLSAFAPRRLAGSSYTPFIESIRAAMTGVGGLRVDHIMGFFQLFLIPDGAEPAEGTYVRYPAEDLLGILALESQRAQALVIGEDLFTVEPGMRDTLAARDILSSRLVWFEHDPDNRELPRRAADYPRLAMAVVATHDLPTIAGLFSDSDLHLQRDLGLVPPERFQAVFETNQRFKEELLRLLQREGLLMEASTDLSSIITALHAFLARTSAMLVAARLEDVLEVHQRPNIPGIRWQERPENWNLPLPALLERLHDDPRLKRHTATLRER